ncbi:MAG: acyl-CoA dehydrogenase family protein [Nitriliruptorales bacterium]|nr:acyl-CoA dehydrogenase family protein [Nitriliruptorales bacterium]
MADTSTDQQRELVDERLERLFDEHPPGETDDQEFWGAQYDLGLAWVQFPEGKGGLGVSPRFQKRVNDAIEDAGGSIENRYRNLLGIGMGAGTLIAHATEEQQDRWLRPMFTMEELWCQLFSEPGAGSDLAGLATSAEREGDEWIVNGQKVWTTLAHRSKWGMIVTRTDPDVPKHAGLTYFIVDMEADGVSVRPLYQITGEAEFNEVYFDDVHIPDENRIGEVGAGWSVAMATLMNERVAIGASVVPRGSGAIGQAVATWNERDLDDPVKRDELTRHWIAAEAQRLTAARASEARQKGTPGPEGSTAKLQWAELNKAITSFTMDLLGEEGLLYPDGYELVRPDETGTRTPSRHKAFLRARANSIEGGTSEIMKNILGERVLGLPGEPRVDKNIPWKEVPRS